LDMRITPFEVFNEMRVSEEGYILGHVSESLKVIERGSKLDDSVIINFK